MNHEPASNASCPGAGTRTAALPGFGEFAGRTWLNTAHQGALPLVAAAAAREAVDWKTAPFELTQERFDEVPARLRIALGRLVNVPADDIIIANSASYGLHLLAAGFPWREGDEVIVSERDFPSDILPWLLTERTHGIRVVRLPTRGPIVEPDELTAAITSRTRLFCTTLVHSFSGHAIDAETLGSICRQHGIAFILNASQALGARSLDLAQMPVDALTCVGFKWLCGPYGTGFCWIRPALRRTLRPTKAYWLAMLTAEDLGKDVIPVDVPDDIGARAYDIFGTANFFNAVPFTVAIEHLLSIGTATVESHDQSLVGRFLDGLERSQYELTSPLERTKRRSTLIFFSHRDRMKNRSIYEALANAGVHIAFRSGSLRLSPHLYNSAADIERALQVLREVA
jgi:selenocysteine lyase/cysteine desulfurase